MHYFDTVIKISLKRHNTNILSLSMYKIDDKYVSCAHLLTSTPLYVVQVSKFTILNITSHDMIRIIK